jgi:biopolymer transport protein ExbB
MSLVLAAVGIAWMGPFTQVLAQANPSLMQAYKKEFVFLKNEKASLRKRLNETEGEYARRVRKAKAELNGLQDSLLAKSAEADSASEELRRAQLRVENYEEIAEVLDSTLYQAMVTLEGQGIQAPEFSTDNVERKKEQIEFIFSESVSSLTKLGNITKEAGHFFLLDGTRTEGTLVRVGNVASLGVSDGGSGTLAPAGGGHLKLWNGATAKAAKALGSNERPDVLPLYLYESLDQMAQQAQDKTAGEVVESGGIIAYVILILGVFAAVMLVLRAFLLWKSGSNTSRLVDQVAPLVQQGEPEKSLDVLKNEKGAAARVLAATVRHLDTDPDQLEDIISENILHETPHLERFESAIMVFAAVAPLLGLLGTVTGMISTFDVITEFGTGDPKLLSGGISEALVTTQLGLMVAIPALLLGNLLSGWSEKIKSGMEIAALKITNLSRTERPAAIAG